MGINKQDMANAGRWMRDHFSNWFANSFVMMGVFIIIIGAIIIGMYFDGTYAVRWSPDEEAKGVFRGYGWLISLAMVFFTSAGVKAFQEGAKWAGGAFIFFGLYFTVLSVTQSIGVVTLKAQEKMAYADAYERVETVNVDRMSELRAMRTQKLDSKNDEIKRIEASIDAIRNDGIAGINAADLREIGRLNDSIAELRNSTNDGIEEIDALILAELQAPTEQEAVTVAPARFDAGIDFWAYVLTAGKPTDEYKEGLTYWYMLFWSIGCPIMGLMLSLYLVITRRTSQAADQKDPVRVAAGEKAAQTRKRRRRQTEKIGQQAESYIKNYEHALRLARNTKWSADGIANSAFKLPAGGMEDRLSLMVRADLIPQEHVEWIMRRAEVPEGKSNAVDDINAPLQLTNGEDKGDADDTSDNTSDLS